MGIEPYAPVRDNHYTYDVARAANPIANYVLLALGIVATGVALAVGNALSNIYVPLQVAACRFLISSPGGSISP